VPDHLGYRPNQGAASKQELAEAYFHTPRIPPITMNVTA
jgi:hypothetical protein